MDKRERVTISVCLIMAGLFVINYTGLGVASRQGRTQVNAAALVMCTVGLCV